MRLLDGVMALTIVAACSAEPADPFNESATDEGGPAPCTPGEQVACACPGGQPDGVQVCNDEGDRFGPCMGCDAQASGDDGADDAAASTGGAGDGGGPLDDGVGSESGDEGAQPMPGWPSGPPQAVPPAPPPDGYPIVEQVALERPDLLLASCVDTGGNNEFLFEVVRRLRMQDDRWGLNWKRGVIGDLSQDVVDYQWGEGQSEENTDVYIIDMIVGHCGDNPQAGWIDVTQATLDGGTIGMWTLAGQDL